jgi:hypothetical protein
MNYYEYEKSQQTCSHCNWDGPGRETPILESFAELAERACPRCGEKIAVVMYPTLAESRANWQDVEPAERSYFEAIEASQKDFTARSLKSPSQLPEIPVPVFALFWDDDGKEGEGGDTVIRLGDLVVWQEACVYEGYWRFDEIAAILRTKYGSALQDLEPTRRIELYLYGDKWSASDSVTATRNALRAQAVLPLPPIK